MEYVLGVFLVLQGVIWWWLVKQIRELERIYAEDVEHYQDGEFCAYIECPMDRPRRKGVCALHGFCRVSRFRQYLSSEGFSIVRPRNRERKSKKDPY